MKRLVLQAVLLLAALAAVPSASASIIHFTAMLSGANESPANASPATGMAMVDIDTVLNTMAVSASFSGLTGTTTMAHIHCCTLVPGTGNTGVATTPPAFAGFPLGVTSGSFMNTFDLTAAGSYNRAFITANGGTAALAEAALIAGMVGGRTYFNIHTTTFPGGEVRGFIQAVPEPWTLGLLASGVVGAWVGRRRRRAR